jgi:hypothetical protein
MATINEPAREIPVFEEADVCVVGGSATGVFAAVRAARLGARVVLVEKANCFGGNATLSMVNDWHNIHDIHGQQQVIRGLTTEVVEGLLARGAAELHVNDRTYARYNTEEMKIELDRLVAENDSIVPVLDSRFAAPIMEHDRIRAICIENKSGRSAIVAKVFVDATGDGDLAWKVGVPYRVSDNPMPGTTCAKIDGLPPKEVFNLTEAIKEHREEFGIREDYGWYGAIPGSDNVTLHFDLHVFDFDATDARSLTAAEMRGRSQVAAVLDLARKYAPAGARIALVDLPARVGIRESRHFECRHHLTGDELLAGVEFPDAIGYGTYPPDIHDGENGSTHLKYLDGRELRSSFGAHRVWGRWRPEATPSPPFYQIPYRSLVPGGVPNLLITGRAIDADAWAHGAIRVMVNCNQTGEAAGVAAWLAADGDAPVHAVPADEIRRLLVAGGSADVG